MHGMPYQLLRLIVAVRAVLSVFLSIVICRNFYASNVFLNLRDVVSCQSTTDLSFLLAVLVNFVYLLLINSYYIKYCLNVVFLEILMPSTVQITYKKAEHLDHFKALRHGSHSFTFNKHHACLYLVSVRSPDGASTD